MRYIQNGWLMTHGKSYVNGMMTGPTPMIQETSIHPCRTPYLSSEMEMIDSGRLWGPVSFREIQMRLQGCSHARCKVKQGAFISSGNLWTSMNISETLTSYEHFPWDLHSIFHQISRFPLEFRYFSWHFPWHFPWDSPPLLHRRPNIAGEDSWRRRPPGDMGEPGPESWDRRGGGEMSMGKAMGKPWENRRWKWIMNG